MNIRPIFWSQTDDSVIEFTLNNSPLQLISKIYPVYLVYSGGTRSSELIKKYSNLKIIHSDKNNDNYKAKLLFDHLKTSNLQYDVSIRTCVDTLILNCNILFKICETHLDKTSEFLIGNADPDFIKTKDLKWIRGACNITSKSLIDKLDINGESSASYDSVYFNACLAAKASIIIHDTFCIGRNYNQNFAAWHPPKCSMQRRLDIHKEIVNKWKK
jgi:hypothetical protein